jgi:hypothetical protein
MVFVVIAILDIRNRGKPSVLRKRSRVARRGRPAGAARARGRRKMDGILSHIVVPLALDAVAGVHYGSRIAGSRRRDMMVLIVSLALESGRA